jgi:hypothetical protein
MDDDLELDDGTLPDEDTDPDSPRNDAASADDVEGPPEEVPVAAERRGGF